MTDQKCCPCGGVILADTEDWKVPVCYECFESHEPSYDQGRADAQADAKVLVDALHIIYQETGNVAAWEVAKNALASYRKAIGSEES